MKKLILAALSVAAFGTANAQLNASASTNLTLNIADCITIKASESQMNSNIAGNANSQHWGAYFTATSTPSWSVDNIYTVQSNRYYNVTMQLAPITFTGNQGYAGNNTTMLPGTLGYYQVSNNTGGSWAIPGYAPFSAFSTDIPVLNNCPYTPGAGGTGVGSSPANTGKTFAMKFIAFPDWNYAGGTYNTTVTMTATQE